jgi:3-hydroxyisobutyrate dehydrogenase-like beta-hydroxyacid dehydrogenase
MTAPATPRPRVGFIGLGSQGGPMARRIAEAGFPTTLWARRPETLAAFADTGAAVAGSAAELAAASDIACVCVVDDAGVEEVVSGPEGLLAGIGPGGLIAVHSTVHPDTCRRLADLAAAKGTAFVDAPVSGGGHAAAQGRLLVMAAGDTAAVERARPVFESYGDPVLHLGDVGAGQSAKLINNLMMAANLGVAESGFALAARLGVDRSQLSRVLAHGSGGSFSASVLGPPDFTAAPLAEHAGPLLRKDVRLVVALADGGGDAKAGTVLAAADAALESLGHPR